MKLSLIDFGLVHHGVAFCASASVAGLCVLIFVLASSAKLLCKLLPVSSS